MNRLSLIAALKCPLCGNVLSQEGQSLLCTARHCFDISREGYVNLALSADRSKYDKALFTSRRAIHQRGFFAPLVDAVIQVLNENQKDGDRIIVDAGCGEGSLLNDVITHTSHSTSSIGIDIAKEGVRMAAKQFKEPLWLCADLAHMPLQDHSADVILNILSPANYGEFTRILRPGGLLIKAIPGADHLRQIRESISDKSEYSNEDVLRLYGEHFTNTTGIEIRQTLPFDQDAASHLVRMTPLSWSRGIDEGIVSSTAKATLHMVMLVSIV